MNEMPDTPAPQKNNTGLIIGIVVVVLFCFCCIAAIGGWWLWNNGDNLVSAIQQFI